MENEITPTDDAWERGRRSVYRDLLGQCLSVLGYNIMAEKREHLALIAEREDAIAQLRELCEDFGDNDWTPDLHLGDIIEKHLGKRLWATYDITKEEIEEAGMEDAD